MNQSKTAKKKAETNPKGRAEKTSSWFVIIMASAGIGICLYLYSIHVALLMGEIKGSLLCGPGNGLGCQSVASSPYSSMMGLPLASWGVIFYSALLLLGLGGVIFWRDCGRAFLRWVLFLAVLGFAVDLYLAHTMIFRIRGVCWLCIATYAINFVIILILVKQVRKEPDPRASLGAIFPEKSNGPGIELYYRNVIKAFLLGSVLFTIVFGVAGFQYLSRSLTQNDREQLVKIIENLSRQHPQFMEVKHRPFWGPDNAKLTVVEFSDFLCPYCAKTAKYIKIAESGSHGTARFVFRHFPLDTSCNRGISSNIHPGSCLLAEGAVCADEQNKFWEYHDKAFETKGKISQSKVMDIALSIGLNLKAFKGCLDSGRALKEVREDINAAFKAGVRSTPTLFINGRRLVGIPKPWVFNEILKYSEKNQTPR